MAQRIINFSAGPAKLPQEVSLFTFICMARRSAVSEGGDNDISFILDDPFLSVHYCNILLKQFLICYLIEQMQ